MDDCKAVGVEGMGFDDVYGVPNTECIWGWTGWRREFWTICYCIAALYTFCGVGVEGWTPGIFMLISRWKLGSIDEIAIENLGFLLGFCNSDRYWDATFFLYCLPVMNLLSMTSIFSWTDLSETMVEPSSLAMLYLLDG